MIRQPYTTVSGAFELPRIVQLDDNLYAAKAAGRNQVVG